MDPLLIGGLSVAAMLVLMFLGIPVAVAMCVVSGFSMWLTVGETYMMATFLTLPYNVASSYAFAAVPMFVMMGIVAGSTGIIRELYTAAHVWLARVRGALYMATTLASAGFGAVNGSTIVGAVLFTRVALPEMVQLGYSRAAGAGCIAAAGTFAAMIPPSITMVLYGIITGESIGRLLIAGIVPGALTALVYMAGIAAFVRIWPKWAPPPAEHFTMTQRLGSLRNIWPVFVLGFIVMGGIYSGLVSPSAAGAVGACGAVLIGLVQRRLKSTDFLYSIKDAATITSVLFFVVIGGLLFSRLLLVTGFVNELLFLVEDYGLEPWMLIGLLMVVYVILGMLMDPISMMVMTVPIVHPLVTSMGFDAIWFAIIMVKLIELSCITPPVGINLFALVSASRGQVGAGEVFRGVLPFVFLELIVLGMLLSMPRIVTALPNAMM